MAKIKQVPWNKGKLGWKKKKLKYGDINPPYIKDCPECGKEMNYSDKYCLVNAIKNNRKCNSCANRGKGWQTGKYGYERTPEINKKSRKSAIKYIASVNGQVSPRYNKSSIPIIEQYGKEHGYDFQHAENGGEYHIKELGYFVDAYDKENNIVLEIDESQHFDLDGNLKEKDLIRQQEIEEYLGCKFIRIKIEEII